MGHELRSELVQNVEWCSEERREVEEKLVTDVEASNPIFRFLLFSESSETIFRISSL